VSAAPVPTPERPKVVYVMGAGRSGSTILGVALGNCPGVFYAGELDAWLSRGGEPNFGGAARESFWRGVKREMPPEAKQLYGERPLRWIEHSASLLRFHVGARRLRRRYRRVAEQLYLATAARAGAAHLVDSSHYPLRARQLQRVAGIELYLVYLVREPESVVAAFEREDVDQPSKRPLAANLYLHLTGLLSTFVFLRQPPERRIFVRYEEFVADPLGVLSAVGELCGAATGDLDLSRLRTGNAFQGNRLLRSPQVSFQAGAAAPPRRRLTALTQRPWRLVLSRLRPAAAPPPADGPDRAAALSSRAA
jgi:hypothetical protein